MEDKDLCNDSTRRHHKMEDKNLCNGSTRRLCKEESCHKCFQKSFASHEKARCWSDKNNLKPREVLKNSGKKYWFNCNKCLHLFESTLYNINRYKRSLGFHDE